MNVWMLLSLFLFGIIVCECGSYFAHKCERGSEDMYATIITIVFLGIFLSVFALLKLHNIATKQLRGQV